MPPSPSEATSLPDKPGSLSPDEWLSLLRGDQRRRWLGGDRVMVESYLERWPTLAEDVQGLLDLVYAEVLLREELGETPTLDEYLRRFPSHADSLKRQFALHRALADGKLLSVSETDSPPPTPEGEGRTRSLPPVPTDDPPTRAGSPNEKQGPAIPPTEGEAPSPTEAFPNTVVAPRRADDGAVDWPRPFVPGYEVLRGLGRGGMGVVYQAQQVGLNRLVALKMILSGNLASREELARFRAEAEIIASLRHPNIIQIHEIGEWQRHHFFSMEFIEGGKLADALRQKAWSPREAAELLKVLAQAVQAAHQRGIVHRDLKPANILLTDDGTPKIADFGLAKRFDADKGWTGSGAIMGTPPYMAPEQAAGKSKDVGEPADVYALGAILYELLTGRPPFTATTVLDMLKKVVECAPEPPRSSNARLDGGLEAICLKCLEKEQKNRYASAEELAEGLDRWLTGQPIRARGVGQEAYGGVAYSRPTHPRAGSRVARADGYRFVGSNDCLEEIPPGSSTLPVDWSWLGGLCLPLPCKPDFKVGQIHLFTPPVAEGELAADCFPLSGRIGDFDLASLELGFKKALAVKFFGVGVSRFGSIARTHPPILHAFEVESHREKQRGRIYFQEPPASTEGLLIVSASGGQKGRIYFRGR
jgi:predicted Ser/Thr protein kinase